VGEGSYLVTLQKPYTRLSTIHRIREQFQELSSLWYSRCNATHLSSKAVL
jgi:hypothetical protein